MTERKEIFGNKRARPVSSIGSRLRILNRSELDGSKFIQKGQPGRRKESKIASQCRVPVKTVYFGVNQTWSQIPLTLHIIDALVHTGVLA